jgi:putative flippase GtrA
MNRQAIGFILVGILAGVVNVVSRLIFNFFVPYEFAVVLAFPLALSVAFMLNRRHVFRAAAGDVTIQYVKFGIVNLIALAQVWIVSVCLARILFPNVGMTWHAETVAHIFGVASPIVTSFLAYKYYVFSRSASVQ